MTLQLFGRRFQSKAGVAHGSVTWYKATNLCPAFLRATLAFETLRNPELLDGPVYDISFAVAEEKRAIRCLKAAAWRRGLRTLPSNNAFSAQS